MFKRVTCPGEGVTGLGVEFFHEGWTLHESDKKEPVYGAIVPGNVRTALMHAGAIADPFVRKNNELSKWISDVAWTYENELNLSSWKRKILDKISGGGILHLVFDAIDYDATFYINEFEACRQTGMFSPVDIAIGITPSMVEESAKIKVNFHVQPWWRQHAVKCQMAFEWDFAPDIRTIGIWKDVRAHFTGPAYFSEALVSANPIDPSKPSIVEVNAKCKVEMRDPETMGPIPRAKSLKFQVTVDDETREFSSEVSHDKSFILDFGKVDAPIWQPWSLGKQERLPVKIEMLWEGEVSDEFRGVLVNRRVQWLTNPGTLRGNEKWTLMINDRKMFLRGFNWVPPDSLFGRIDKERYQRLIDAAINMNIDIFRIWGGGIEEKPEFYDYCDEVGMMVWQEFPFACTNYPRDPRYLQIVKNEVEGMVKRTRRHPSVVVYCGGNEFNPYINSHIIKIVTEVVAKHAPGIHCFHCSPYSGDDHNWRIYGKKSLLNAYDINGKGPFKMLTEFGIRGAPGEETLKIIVGNVLDGKDLESISSDLQYHKADVNNIKAFAKIFCQEIKDIPQMIRVSQSIQAYALKYAIEACRSGWPNVSGVFPWQFSDPWPNYSWSVIDYHFRPKLSSKLVKLAYSPILPMVRTWQKVRRRENYVRGNVIVHNATQEPFSGKLVVEVVKKDKKAKDKLQYSKEMNINVSSQRPLKVMDVEVKKLQGTVVRLYLKDTQSNLIAKNFHYPSMEPLCSSSKRLMDTLNARFDGWWRKYMTKLMENEKIREELRIWKQKSREREEKTESSGKERI
ncbi:MAG: glycoside hydrolase family 2 TIM barrel-domain containing protein [Candidatus Hodarchaeota archaeon]